MPYPKVTPATSQPSGLVFNVQSFSVHDGPGIRIEFFLKGCPLRCEWCSNPEGINLAPEPGCYPQKCMGAAECGLCLRACQQGALLFTDAGFLGAVDRDRCSGCLVCTQACLTGALQAWGKRYSVDEAMAAIRKDRAFFERTGGGVTVSGGEALLQPQFVLALFAQCQTEGIHTCLESSLHVTPSTLTPFLGCTDLFIADIKHMNADKHRARCGASNELILANLVNLADKGAQLIIRTPILKGFNASDAEIRAIGDFILGSLGNRILQHQLLPYRQLGTEKYASLDRPYPLANFAGYDRDEWEPDIRRYIALLQDMGINAVSGNNKRL